MGQFFFSLSLLLTEFTVEDFTLLQQFKKFLLNSMDCSPPGPSLRGILQARILESVAIPFSRDPPDPGIEPGSPTLQANSLPSEPPGKPLRNKPTHF